jgi:periplasmic divalent cation tolerance protein
LTETGSGSTRVVLVTVPDEETGRALAQALVGDRLAACGNVIPGVTSIYRWRGEVHQDPECLIIFKTTKAALPALKRRVVELHPYEVPEILALAPVDGHLPYLEWVRAEVEETERS